MTVRDICRAARANVAAVNYHFGDKLGLYREVLQSAIDVMRATNDAAREAGAGQPAEEQLRRYIAIFVRRVLGPGNDIVHKLIHREMNDPTPALDTLVEQGVRPRVEYLSGVVARSSAARRRISACCAASPACRRSRLRTCRTRSRRASASRSSRRAANLDDIADHIAEFSLAGIHAVGRAVHAR